MSDSDLSNTSLHDLFQLMSNVDEDILLSERGYMKEENICDTLQGTLYKASTLRNGRRQRVAIKKTLKDFAQQKESKPVDGFHFCVAEDIVQEGEVLQYLSANSSTYRPYIVQFVDSFESDDAYYLVMEYVPSALTLRGFVRRSHEYIKAGLLSFTEYTKITKFLLWQLFTTVSWLHCQAKCCHLDLNVDNVMVENAGFSAEKDGQIHIERDINIKIIDFGVSEMFASKDFSCDKHELNVENEAYLAPEIFRGETYNAMTADSWALGIIMFECLANRPLYDPSDIEAVSGGYLALENETLPLYLQQCKLGKNFSPNACALLSQLLMMDGKRRLTAAEALKSKWFQSYFQCYQQRVAQILR